MDESLIIECAKLANESYKNGYVIRNQQILTKVCEDFVIIAFSGTDFSDYRDDLEDLLVIPHWTGIHLGFWMAYKTVEGFVESLVNLYGTTKRIYFTGHSMGGCTAQVASYYLKHPCITFGAPALYLWWFGPLINHIRVKMKWDMVPDYPPFFKHIESHYIEIQNPYTDAGVPSHRIVNYISKLEDYFAKPT